MPPTRPRHSDPPRDEVRRIPLTGSGVALIGLDARGNSRMTVIIESHDVSPELTLIIQNWVRTHYPD